LALGLDFEGEGEEEEAILEGASLSSSLSLFFGGDDNDSREEGESTTAGPGAWYPVYPEGRV